MDKYKENVKRELKTIILRELRYNTTQLNNIEVRMGYHDRIRDVKYNYLMCKSDRLAYMLDRTIDLIF